MELIKRLLQIKYFILYLLVIIGLASMANLKGYRIMGDDEDVTEKHAGVGVHTFYHK